MATRSCEFAAFAMLTKTSTRLFGSTNPASRTASSTLMVTARWPSGTSIGMMPPFPESWGASFPSRSGSPATMELRTTRPSASARLRMAPVGTACRGHGSTFTCLLVIVSARSMLTAATTISSLVCCLAAARNSATTR